MIWYVVVDRQVVVNSITDPSGISWTGVTATVYSVYTNVMHSWHALVYSFSAGMVVALTLASTWIAQYFIREAGLRRRYYARMRQPKSLRRVFTIDSSPSMESPMLASPTDTTVMLGDTGTRDKWTSRDDISPMKSTVYQDLTGSSRCLVINASSRSRMIAGLSEAFSENVTEKATTEQGCVTAADLCMRLLEAHFVSPVANAAAGTHSRLMALMNGRANGLANELSGNGRLFFGVDHHSKSEEERTWQWRRVRVFESARRMLVCALSDRPM